MQNKFKSGFTLIELGIVLIIIFILALLSVPQFSQLVKKSKETKTRIAMTELKDAIYTYYEKNGVYPVDLTQPEFLGKYIKKIPVVKLGGHHHDSAELKLGEEIDDSGGWIYNPATGNISVNCSHKDTKGQEISKW